MTLRSAATIHRRKERGFFTSRYLISEEQNTKGKGAAGVYRDR